MQRSNRPFAHLELCSALESLDPGLSREAFKRLGRLAQPARAAVRQQLVETATYQHLLPELMSAVAYPHSPVGVTAPPAWREALRARGVRVAPGSVLRWWSLVAELYASGLWAAVSRARDVLAGRMRSSPHDPYAVLLHLSSNMIPRGVGCGFDFLSWYLQSDARPPGISEIWAHVTGRPGASSNPLVTTTSQYLPSLRSFSQKARFLGALTWTVIESTIRGMTGNWWDVALLAQLVDVAYARQLPPSQFARAYVFNNARFIVRPLWTYIAEDAGASVDLVFYGSNIETFGARNDQPRPVWPGYRGMTWPRYVVWDEVQADFLHGLGIASPAVIGGPIGLTDAPVMTEPPEKPYVVVFDVTPHRPASLAKRGLPQPYYTPEVWRRFMTEIQTALTANGFYMVYKKKREIGRVAAPTFRSELDALSNQKRAIAVDPDIAPNRLIVDAAGVISMPFTSTALIARSMGKPTIYYDPLGVLVDEDRLAHGVRVIGKMRELAQWLAALQEAVASVARPPRS